MRSLCTSLARARNDELRRGDPPSRPSAILTCPECLRTQRLGRIAWKRFILACWRRRSITFRSAPGEVTDKEAQNSVAAGAPIASILDGCPMFEPLFHDQRGEAVHGRPSERHVV